jgi:hypothetical protein
MSHYSAERAAQVSTQRIRRHCSSSSGPETPSGATFTTFCTFRRELSSLRWTISRLRTANLPRGVERRDGTADDHPHDDHWARSAALRPPASESRPTHRGHDHRNGPRSPSLDGAGVAWQRARSWSVWMWRISVSRNSDRRSLSCGDASASSRRGFASCWPCYEPPGLASQERASAGGTRQNADPSRHRSDPRVPPLASGPAASHFPAVERVMVRAELDKCSPIGYAYHR